MVDISIIVPIYKTDLQLLRNCLNSLINQSKSEIEIIIIFDGENNEQFDFCRKFNFKNKAVQLIKTKHSGVSTVRNIGICKAIGNYVMFCDADDFFDRYICEKAYIAIKNGDYDIVIWDYACVYPNRTELNKIYKDDSIIFEGDQKYQIFFSNICRKLDLKQNRNTKFGIGGVWNRIYKRSFILENNIFFDVDCHISEDILFNLYCCEKAHKIFYFSYSGYFYTINNNSASTQYNLNILIYNKIYLNKIQRLFNELVQNQNNFIVKNYNLDEIYNAISVNSLLRVLTQIFNNRKLIGYKEVDNIFRTERKEYKMSISKAKLKFFTLRQGIAVVCLKLNLLSILKFFLFLKNNI